jgi:hypothetical protein
MKDQIEMQGEKSAFAVGQLETDLFSRIVAASNEVIQAPSISRKTTVSLGDLVKFREFAR